MKSEDRYVSLKPDWYDSPKHAELDMVALHLGPWLLLHAKLVDDDEPHIGELVDDDGKPLTAEAIATATRGKPAEIEAALRSLVLCGTMMVRPGGAWAFPNIWEWIGYD